MVDHDSTTAPKPLACEIAAYTEEELDRYLEWSGRTRIVSVQDPENISPEFVQRLRDTIQRAETKSRPVDLDQVAARLQTVSDGHEPPSRSPSLATTLSYPPQEEQDQEDLIKETGYFNALVAAGGRPPYPFHLLESFLWNPEQYLEYEQFRDIVSFWRDQVSNKAERTHICGRHLSRWESFRRLQRIIRDRSVMSEWTLIDAASWDSWEAFVGRHGPKDGQWGFAEYAERITRRLAKYGFTPSFQLDRDPDRQDKMTTWIEYLGYEYWFYDEAVSCVKRLQRRHDEAWNELVDSNLLGPDETYEVICDIDISFRHANEEERAKTAVESAKTAVSSTEKAIASSQPPRDMLRKRLLADQSRLNVATGRHETIRAKIDSVTAFLQRTRRYRCAKDEADRHGRLLRWIEQQIPSIELELNHLHGVEDDPDRAGGSGRPKRARAAEHNKAQRPQKRRRATDDADRMPGVTLSPIRTSSKRSRYSSIDRGRPPKRSKTSGRNGPASYLESDTPAPATLSLISAPEPTQDLDGGHVSREPLRVLKPLRRSARIANQKKKSGMIATGATTLRPPTGDRLRHTKSIT